jgi:hypothetical protein
MPFKLSPSSLGLFEECSRCFWLTQHKKWSRPNGIFPTLPSGMDRVLKHHFDRFSRKGLLPPELCDHNHCNGLKLFDDENLLEVWRSNFKGLQWKDEEGNVLRGAIDNLLVNGKKFIVLDYKTRGYEVKKDTAEKYQRQLNIYNFLLRKNGYETEDYGFLLFYHPKEVLENGDVVFHKELVKMKTHPHDGEKVFNAAIKLLNGVIFCIILLYINLY